MAETIWQATGSTRVSKTYPPMAYLTRCDDGTYALTVRSAGDKDGVYNGTINLTSLQLAEFADRISMENRRYG